MDNRYSFRAAYPEAHSANAGSSGNRFGTAERSRCAPENDLVWAWAFESGASALWV